MIGTWFGADWLETDTETDLLAAETTNIGGVNATGQLFGSHRRRRQLEQQQQQCSPRMR